MSLTIRIKRAKDGSTSLTLTRADGTTTWQNNQGAKAAFFPAHDLTHYAVETELGFDNAFYGLVAQGWDIGDFGAPWRRGPLPPEAGRAEIIVGFLDAERATGERWTAAEFLEKAELLAAARRSPSANVRITDEQLLRIRKRRAELFAAWAAVEPGEALLLRFPGS